MRKIRKDFLWSCECGYRRCRECGTPWYPMELEPDEKGETKCPDCNSELGPLVKEKEDFENAEAFYDALYLENRGQGMGRNVCQYYLGETWIMNGYESFGGILSGINVWYLLPYRNKEGLGIFPKKHADVEYDETAIFGRVPENDTFGCTPFDCGYGDCWSLETSDESIAHAAAFEMWKRRKQ